MEVVPRFYSLAKNVDYNKSHSIPLVLPNTADITDIKSQPCINSLVYLLLRGGKDVFHLVFLFLLAADFRGCPLFSPVSFDAAIHYRLQLLVGTRFYNSQAESNFMTQFFVRNYYQNTKKLTSQVLVAAGLPFADFRGELYPLQIFPYTGKHVSFNRDARNKREFSTNAHARKRYKMAFAILMHWMVTHEDNIYSTKKLSMTCCDLSDIYARMVHETKCTSKVVIGFQFDTVVLIGEGGLYRHVTHAGLNNGIRPPLLGYHYCRWSKHPRLHFSERTARRMRLLTKIAWTE